MEKTPLLLLLLCYVTTMTSAQTADVEVRINEEEHEGIVVVNLSQYPALFLEVSAEDKNRLTFNILAKGSFQASFFSLDSASGVVSIAKRVDREQVCSSVDTPGGCALDFNVAIQGKDGLTFSNIASVRVYIDDINDNSPSFPAEQVDLEISEGAKLGTVLKLSGAQDLDTLPNNTIQAYNSTLASPPVFSISATRNKDGTSFLSLRLDTVLDREITDRYDFNIVAYDGGNPPRSDFIRVIVKVLDENDNVPVLESEAYNVNVREDASVGSEVVRVRADDKDAGSFGTVSYRFSKLASSTVRRLFAINGTTGVIALKNRIDHSSGNGPYSVVVEAFDGGNPPSVAQTVVTITVLNTGNNAPVVRIVTVSEGDTTEISIPESAKVDDFVAFVNVDDSDEGENGEFTCSMEKNGAQFRLVELLNKGYKVLLAQPVDRELVSRYQAAIVCRDRGSPPLSSETPFTVVIADVNDNDPTFDQSSYTGSLPENNAQGHYILQVSAMDLDTGNNAFLTYSLLDSPTPTSNTASHPAAAPVRDLLTIQPQSGVVTARRPLDREVTPMITCTVKVVDGGDKPRTGTARLTVKVRDLNDNAPQLERTPYHFSVSEGAAPGHVVAILTARDLDEGDNGQVEFFFAGSVNGEVPFAVHPNGTLEVSGVLDRETSRSHIFTVLARDKGAVPKSNSTQVTVTVTDINDNPPAILFPTNANHSVVITTLPENGITLGRIIAYDVDEGNASSLVYKIHSGNVNNVFDIDREKGKLFLVDLRKLKNPHIYHVVLRVYDSGRPPLFAETSLQIEVNFPNATSQFGPGGKPAGSEATGSKKSRDSYIVIVGVIGGATLVLSGIIIGAICFVLRSERHRKSRDSTSSFKNHYVPAPVKFDVPSEKLEDSKCPQSFERKSSQSDVSSSGVILSPKCLQSKGEVQKKVSFSLDEPEMTYDQFGNLREVPSAPFPHHSHHERDAVSMAWKRLVNPDDINSDTSGDSGMCDSGRGTSDDDIHLDSSMDKLSQGKHALTNTNRVPAPANIYAPPSSFHSGGGSFRQQHPGHGGPNRTPAAGSSSGGKSAAGASRPTFLHTGSFHEGRPREGYRTPGGGKMLPQRPALHRPYPHVSPHPQAAPLPGIGHPDPLPPPPAPRGGGGEGGGKHFPPPPPRSGVQPYPHLQPQHRRQGSSLSMEDDGASTTTSGSYTLSPDAEIRLEGNVSPDVIV
ncbi:hypothetical protein ACOMHN_065033 [Nucella lapillus]